VWKSWILEKGLSILGLFNHILTTHLLAVVLSLLVPKSVTTFGDLTPYDMRSVAIWLGDITLILIFILAVLVSKKPVVGLVATFIYGTVPSFVLLSRYALLENVLTPIVLLVSIVAFCVVSQKSGNLRLVKILLVVSGVFTGLGALTKLSGWIMLPAATLLFWKNRINRKDIVKLYILPAITIGLLYFVWGLSLSPATFFNIIYYQGIERGFIGPLNLIVASLRVGIFRFPFDAWWLGGFVAMVYIILKKKSIFLVVPVTFLILFNLIVAGANYPWYYMTLIPFMCISTAWMFNDFFNKINLAKSLLLFLIYFSSSFYWGFSVNFATDPVKNFQQPFLLYRILLLMFMGFGLLSENESFSEKFTNITKVFFIAVIILMIFLNQKSIYFILTNWGSYPSLTTPGPLFVFN
jgi:4-amino-4-deoxy-L-arabinose transferase-like glycosyltransferase